MSNQKPRQANVKVRVSRAFLYAGKIIDPGTELTLPAPLAAELTNARRIEPVDQEPSEYHVQCLADAKARAARKAAAAPRPRQAAAAAA